MEFEVLHPNGHWKEHGGWSASHTGTTQWKNSFNKIWDLLVNICLLCIFWVATKIFVGNIQAIVIFLE